MMKKLLQLTAVAILGGCSILPSNPPVAVYDLSQTTSVQKMAISKPLTLHVSKPYAQQFLDTQRIAVITPTHEMAVYKGAQWSDTAPVVFANSLIRAVRDSGMYQAVENEMGHSGDVYLQIYLNQMQVDYSTSPAQAVIDVDMNVRKNGANDQPKSHHFRAVYPLSGSSNASLINAFEQANNQLQSQFLAWINQVE